MKKKAGQLIYEVGQEQQDLEDDVIEYRRSMEPEVMSFIYQTIEESKHKDLYRNRDFYIVLTTMIDKVFKQPRIMVWARRSCPTPVYKQSVFKYYHQAERLEFLWSIPDAILYHHILRNAQQFLADKECADLTKFVMLMESGELLTWVKKENGEKEDALIVVSKEDPCLMN